VARGARGNPWIFREAHALLERGETVAPPTALVRIDLAREHARKLVEFSGQHAVLRMRKHVAWYLADMPGATHVRDAVNHCRDFAHLDQLLTQYRTRLESR